MTDIVKLLRPFMNENMEKDLVFYLAHDKELYFKGMVLCAYCSIVGMVAAFVLGILLIRAGAIVGGGLAILLAWVPVGIFCNIKMYLHVRKDSIEIAEKLDRLMEAI